jgi:hypothetical protein
MSGTNGFIVNGVPNVDTNEQFGRTNGLFLRGTNEFFLQTVTNGDGSVISVPRQRPIQ